MQQSQHGAVDIQGYAAYIINIMSSLCSPARDEEIEKLKSVHCQGLVPLFRLACITIKSRGAIDIT